MVDYSSRRRRRSRLHQGLRLPAFLSLQNISFWNKVSRYALYVFILGVIAIPILFFWYSRDLPTPGKLVTGKYTDATRIYDRNHVLLYSVYQDENRTYVGLSQIPKYLQEGTISIEDKDFYKNQGFSPIGYVRVAWNFVRGKGLGGASTITQQLVKNVLLSSERSIPRKIKELILSIQVNQKFSKDEILEMYLNNIPYGGTAIGAEAAAQTYFGKDVKDLDLAQSAFLAGLPQNPSTYTPFSGNKYYLDRTKAVLKRMTEDKYITTDQADKALAEITNYKFTQRGTTIKAPHFVMYVKQLLAQQFGEQMVETGGLQVTTTLDYTMQKQAEDIVEKEIDSLGKYKVGNGAAMITNPKTGEVLTMVGSKDYFGDAAPAGCTSGKDCVFEPNFNAALSPRQPGSSMKPVVYAEAFEKGYTPATMVMDVPTDFQATANDKSYTPVNYDGKFHGPIQLRFALGNSLNIPAVKVLAFAGIKDSMQLAYNMGVNNWQPTTENMQNVGLSLVLGGRETTLYDEIGAYGVFANKGVKKDLFTIQKVTDSRGKVLYEHKDQAGQQVLPPEITFLISHILLDNNARTMEFGPNSALVVPGHTVAVKTGTTDEKKDNWTYGYTPSVVVGVWVGNNDNSPMNQAIASGVTGASPIWHDLMAMALKGKPDEQFQKPDNVIAMQIDPLAGGLPRDGQPTRTEYFIKGTEPTTVSPIYKSKDGKDYWVFTEKDLVSQDGVNRWQQGIDAWIKQNHAGEERYNPPDDLKNDDQKKDDNTTPTPTQSGPTPTPTSTPSPTPTP